MVYLLLLEGIEEGCRKTQEDDEIITPVASKVGVASVVNFD